MTLIAPKSSFATIPKVEVTAMMMDIGSFSRWAVRNGTVVEWGNLIGPYIGQQFKETFGSEVEAIERERQANALEPISINREPIALVRVRI